MIGFGAEITSPRCSRAGCGEPATASINWRNPKIHTPERVKVWLACAEHADFLRDYLATRGFPVSVTPVGFPVATVEAGSR